MEEFEDYVPHSTTFAVGYFEGQTKRWICDEVDLRKLYDVYAKYPDKEILLWCEGRSDEDSDIYVSHKAKKKKKTGSEHKSKREEKEDSVKVLAEELQAQHKDKLDLNEVQYRLWSRMLIAGIHSSRDVPPQVPLITGSNTPNKPKCNAFEETIVKAATAVMKAITNHHSQATQIQNINDCPVLAAGISPSKAVDIRGKSLGQLSTLKELFVDGILSQEEYMEQKDIIIRGLKKLK